MVTDDQTQTKSRRALPIILIALGIFVVILIMGVVIIMNYPLEPHFPPEDPEITAMRQSPDNGYFMLEEAAKLKFMPLHSVANPFSDWPEYDDSWKAGWVDDPEREKEFVQFFEEVSPALSMMREALDAEYYLFPEIGDLSMELPYLSTWRWVARVLVAEAKWNESQGRYDKAMEN